MTSPGFSPGFFLFKFQVATKKTPALAEVFCKGLSLLYVHCILSLWGIFDIKGNAVTFLKFVESDSNERIAVKEKIFVLTFNGNETKTLVSLFLYYTIHRFIVVKCKLQRSSAVRRIRLSAKNIINETRLLFYILFCRNKYTTNLFFRQG